MTGTKKIFLSKLAQGIGARALARFIVQNAAAQKMPRPLSVCELKRRERRAPLRHAFRHLISRALITTGLLAVLLVSAVSAQATDNISAAAKPGHEWRSYPTRTLADLPADMTARTNPALTRYGGLAASPLPATGFFYATNLNGRWWLVDPAGGRFLNQAVVSVTPQRSPASQPAFEKFFGSVTNWAVQTTALLRDLDFNGLGAWSETEALEAVPSPLPYTRIWNFMATYGRQRGGTYSQPGHTGFPNDCIFVFDPEFVVFCDNYAKQLSAGKDDPNLLGHFSDNELPFKLGLLAKYLALPANDPGAQAAWQWLRARHGATAAVAAITEQDDRDFLELVVARYYRIVSTAIKKYDPNHLFLGSRFHGKALAESEIFRAAGPYADVVSVNYYNAWTPDQTRLARWASEAHKPILVTEFYVKGEDSGMGNTGGAGWLVKTQRERGAFYENFTLGLLQSKVCVGWQWFKYIDNDPADTKTDPSNRDANKGLLNNRYEAYALLQASMKAINERVYPLADYFDSRPRLQATAGGTGKLGE
jgi:hypothetical protein